MSSIIVPCVQLEQSSDTDVMYDLSFLHYSSRSVTVLLSLSLLFHYYYHCYYNIFLFFTKPLLDIYLVSMLGRHRTCNISFLLLHGHGNRNTLET